MSRKAKQKEILYNIEVEQVAAEGNSLSHVDGKVIFVPQVIPGDVIDVQVIRKKSGYMEGRCINMVKPSQDRMDPFCEHYGSCGGCKWQPLPYPLQLKYKQQQVYDQLTRIGKLELPSEGISEILGSVKTTQYRNKLEFTFSDRRWIFAGESPELLFDPPIELKREDFPNGVFPSYLKNGYSSINKRPDGFGLGFHIVGSFDKVLDIHKCHLQMEPTNQIRLFIKKYAIENNISFFNLREQKGELRSLIVRNNSKGDFMVTVVFGGDANKRLSSILSPLLDALQTSFPQIKSLNYVVNDKKNDTIGDLSIINYSGDDAIYEEMEGLRFKIGPKSFYQTNSDQAYRLYSIVRKLADFKGDERVYDLYTGTGTIALFIARNVGSVIGIEYVPEAIEDAKVNALNNGIDNCSFFAGDMKDILSEEFISNNGGDPDVIILDPPRAGIHPDVAKVILQASPSKILYISCNPATQARDLSIFSQQYSIVAVAPVDMFPHTHHVENIVSLIKKP